MGSLVHVAKLLIFISSCLPWFISSGNRASEYRTVRVEQGDGRLADTAPSTVSWIGDTWILPPHQRLFLPLEIRKFFNDHSIVMIGDHEVSRIHYGTIVEILLDSSKHVSKNVLNNSTRLDRRYTVDTSNCTFPNGICRKFNNHKFDFVQLECFDEARQFLRENNLGLYDAIVIATGRLETAVSFQRERCESRDTMTFPQGSIDRMKHLMNELQHLRIPLIWRNGAFSRQTQHDYVELMDKEVRLQLTKTRIKLIDYSASIRERAYLRIPAERAILFLQLLMNALSH